MIVPFFGVGQMERVDQEGIIAAAQPIAELISKIESTKEGRPSMVVFDIHALPERFYFAQNKVVVRMESAQLLLRDVISFTLHADWVEEGKEQISGIVYPDEGAFKRFKFFFEGIPSIICSKMRGEGDSRVVRIVDEKDFPVNKELVKKHVLIIDDLVQSGGTLRECIEAVKKAGYEKVSAYVTHGVFPNDKWKDWLEESPLCPVANFYITNSTPVVANHLVGARPFVVLPIENRIHSFFLKYRSVSPYKPDQITPLFRSIGSGDDVTVLVASAKGQKMKGVFSAFNHLLSSQSASRVRVIGVGVESDINPQPYGVEETLQGALNRALHAKEFAIKNNLPNGKLMMIVSIESGLVEKNGKVIDVCAVVVNRIDDEEYKPSIPLQYGTIVPGEYVEASRQSKFNTTAGKLMETAFNWKADSWHSHVTSFDRSVFLSYALVSSISSSLPSLPSHAPNTLLYP